MPTPSKNYVAVTVISNFGSKLLYLVVVEKRKWTTKQQIIDALSDGQFTPDSVFFQHIHRPSNQHSDRWSRPNNRNKFAFVFVALRTFL
jgi:hypothetical protein